MLLQYTREQSGVLAKLAICPSESRFFNITPANCTDDEEAAALLLPGHRPTEGEASRAVTTAGGNSG